MEAFTYILPWISTFVFILYKYHRYAGEIKKNRAYAGYRDDIISILEKGNNNKWESEKKSPSGKVEVWLRFTLETLSLDVSCLRSGENVFAIGEKVLVTINPSKEEIERCLCELGLLKEGPDP